jgi:hypothetical protein
VKLRRKSTSTPSRVGSTHDPDHRILYGRCAPAQPTAPTRQAKESLLNRARIAVLFVALAASTVQSWAYIVGPQEEQMLPERIAALAPAGVELTRVEVEHDSVRVFGTCRSNAGIGALLRRLDGFAALRSARLQSVTTSDDGRLTFEITSTLVAPDGAIPVR